MYVSKVELKNIRGIGPKGLVFDLATRPVAARGRLAGWNVVAGPNGSGKTTFLQGMAAALLGGTGTGWLLRPADRRDWIHRGGALPSHTDVGSTCTWVEPGPDDELPLQERRVGPVPLLVEWSRDAGAGARTVPPPGDHSFLLRHFWNSAAYGARPDGWMFAAYGASRGNRRSSPDAAELFKGAPRTASVVTLFREDAALEAASTWLLGMELSAARAVGAHASALRDGVLRFLGDGLLVQGEATAMRVEAEGLEVSWNGGWHPARLLGDGNHAVLAMVLDLLHRIEQFKPGGLLRDILTWDPSPGAPIGVGISGAVVIDEPELHLHPELQQRLGFWLKRHFPNIQFIVTTHSPFICQAVDPGGLFRMPSLQAFTPASDETWASVSNGTVDDAVVSTLFGLEHAQSPESVLRRQRFAQLEVSRRRGPLSAEEESEHRRLAHEMPKDPTYEIDTLVQGLLRR